MPARYRRAMELLYVGCIVLSGTAMVVITLIIPYGVFMRYVMNKPQGWPEPAAVVMMVMFSFIGGAAVYRANAQIAVEALIKAVGPRTHEAMVVDQARSPFAAAVAVAADRWLPGNWYVLLGAGAGSLPGLLRHSDG